ncbi:MAG: hypothetical protein JO055_07415 [Alphaproteobacteria bacterium]|nr:hypothetical protein [Alphaproteobacteria bacterium]
MIAAVLRRVGALLVLGALWSVPTLAQQESPKTERVQVGGRDISIPAPFQYCDLDATEERDNLLIEALDKLAGDRKVLRRMAPCDELKQWRKDKDSTPVEVVQTLHDPAAGSTERGRVTFLNGVVAGRPIAGRDAVLKRAADGVPQGTAEYQYGYIGLMERSDRAVMSADAVLIRIDGALEEMASLRAWTVTGGQAILIETLVPYEKDGAAFDWMQTDGRDHVDRLLSANGERARRFDSARPPILDRPDPRIRKPPPIFKPRNPDEEDFFADYGGQIALGMIGGGAVLIIVSLFWSRRVRRPA